MKDYLMQLEFMHPWLLLGLLIIPVLLWFQYVKKQPRNVVKIPHLGPVLDRQTLKSTFAKYLPLLRFLTFSLLIIALARPRLALTEEVVKAEGIDIMMITDLSSSMLAQDFKPDRLEVAKQVASEFIDKREFDRIGLVVFAGEAYTQCPLTTDHRIVQDFLLSLKPGLLDDGTAIGMGLATAVNRLKESESESKVVILLTDGVNNEGYIKPMTAAEIAREFDVKVYTIGIGKRGRALSPISRRNDGQYIFGYANVEIDEELLKEIAKLTGGKYYRAENEDSLISIYAEIDKLEKTEMEVNVFKRYKDQFRIFLQLSFFLICLELILRWFLLKIFP